MSKYVIFKPANETLDKVWSYSLETWGQKKCQEYIEGLFETMKKAASREIIWRNIRQETYLDVYFVKYQRHYIFFRELDDDLIGIISIMHEKRGIVSVLEKEMGQLD
jgi:plasmid stabilization system protein ParE